MDLRIRYGIISIHAPLTGCDAKAKITYQHNYISIHAPLTGCDRMELMAVIKSYENFNPRTPYGMRQDTYSHNLLVLMISIHAPLTGCDTLSLLLYSYQENFNPRTPYGMRPSASVGCISVSVYFNPRTPYGMRL